MENNIVISSRIRLARNLKNYKFPIKMTKEEASKIVEDVENALKHNSKTENGAYENYNLYCLKDMSDIKRNSFIEKHIISPDMAQKKESGAFLVSDDESTAIMVNEEDHIRIQNIGNGLCLDKCWQKCDEIDDMLEETLDYAFDDELGYITSCPTNMGTGMRASVMLHLPALSITNQIDKLWYGVSQIGVAVRGVYGEGTKSMGDLYQISNQGTLGAAEEVLIDKIKQITTQIIEKENMAREQLMKNNKEALEDQVYRAYGILTNAKIISVEEAMKLLSIIKLGEEMNLIDKVNEKNIYETMIKIQPSNIQLNVNKEMTAKEINAKRTEIIKVEMK